ncbi:proline-tRNA ligase [Sphaceloma murrayae]|uniref:proline--tRNA ligase n=1 Tax=Sphaceloma murrayae TaxID=2082308 RepID=A0A2K1QXM8_9PEZI|nr:proline-tRNA ligase [Sphaceloma murrayae]
MSSIGASKLSMSSISSEALWRRSGRLEGKDSELFRFKDRKDTKFLLSPTHEEEITSLVSASVSSYKDLPLRLYQISRKYRDEQRPRQGLLRGREFLMKDLYTFDESVDASARTYDEVRTAYHQIFTALRVPFVTAAADSGSMGGEISHEYHFPHEGGEDRVILCNSCKNVMNEEVAVVELSESAVGQVSMPGEAARQYVISTDRNTLVEIHFPKQFSNNQASGMNSVNAFVVKAALPDLQLDTGTEDALEMWKSSNGQKHIILLDPRLRMNVAPSDPEVEVKQATVRDKPVSLTRPQRGDACHKCNNGTLDVVTAIEVGHTFNLGTRYSRPFDLQVRMADNRLVDVQMGCHGIGVSRILAAVAAVKADAKGLVWPNIIAPFSVLVVPRKGCLEQASDTARKLVEAARKSSETPGRVPWQPLPDIALDDRDKPLGWKLKDADLIGYPIIVVVGSAGQSDVASNVEIQCRQTGYKETDVSDYVAKVGDLLQTLQDGKLES